MRIMTFWLIQLVDPEKNARSHFYVKALFCLSHPVLLLIYFTPQLLRWTFLSNRLTKFFATKWDIASNNENGADPNETAPVCHHICFYTV